MNNYTCKLISPEQAISLQPQLPFWFDPQWMYPVAELYNLPAKVLLCSRNDNPVGWMPLYEKKFITLKKAYNPTLVYYSPLFFSYPERAQQGRELMLEFEICKAVGAFLTKNYQRVSLNLMPQNLDIRGFKEAGLKTVPLYTFGVDLHAKTEIHKHELTTLRKAEKQQYDYVCSYEPDVFMTLLYGMYNRKNHPFPIPREGLGHLLEKLHIAGLIEQYNVVDKGSIVSSIQIIKDNSKTAYAWLSGTAPEALKNGAGVFLLWKLFEVLRNRYEKLDLCGGNSKGPSRVKAALGADLQLFFQLMK